MANTTEKLIVQTLSISNNLDSLSNTIGFLNRCFNRLNTIQNPDLRNVMTTNYMANAMDILFDIFINHSCLKYKWQIKELMVNYNQDNDEKLLALLTQIEENLKILNELRARVNTFFDKLAEQSIATVNSEGIQNPDNE